MVGFEALCAAKPTFLLRREPLMPVPHRFYQLILIGLLTCLSGCLLQNDVPQGLRQADRQGGPRIDFHLEERPFPEIPFPNDLAMRRDPTSPTGYRVNISELGGSKAEENVRRKLNERIGFGLYTPISVSFDAPLDVHNLVRRHQELVPNYEDDAVFLVNIDRDSPNYGRFELLDMGRGNFPILLKEPGRYFTNDPRREGNNLLFESVQEVDTNGNGLLDPIEDTDDDRVWDTPNTLDKGADPLAFGQMLDFYERETHTLIMRPVRPLEPKTTYAVVLSSALRGQNGKAIDSPFDAINHTNQTQTLSVLKQILPKRLPKRFGPRLDNVRFAWSFTTGQPTRTLETVRAGLYGSGPLKRLAKEFPPNVHYVHSVKRKGKEQPMIFNVDRVINTIAPVLAQAVGGSASSALTDSYEHVDYVVSGTFVSPYFLNDKDGLAEPISVKEPGDISGLDERLRQDDDESFDIDLDTGRAQYDRGEVTFVCMIPKTSASIKPPFKTIIYSHAIGSTRFEILAFGGVMAKFGLASCAIDAVGHGLPIPPEFNPLLERAAGNLKLPNLKTVLTHDRARDINNDGVKDIAGDYFTADLLHSRDMIRQTTIDQLQFIRILRTFDGSKKFPASVDENSPFVKARGEAVAPFDADGDGQSEIAGDFNGDGVVDLDTQSSFVAWGTSLGGIQASVLSGIEPTIRTMSSNAGGGGLGDIATRTTIGNVRVGVMLKMMGPTLIGTPAGDNTTEFSWLLPDALNNVTVPFARVQGLEEGDRIKLINVNRSKNPYVPSKERTTYALVRNGRFRLGLAADAINGTARRAKLGFKAVADFNKNILGCKEEDSCADVECPEKHYCAPDNTCQPLNRCVELADLSSLDDAGQKHIAKNPTEFGDPLIIQVFGADDKLKQEIKTFEINAKFQNIIYPAGSTLAALIEGWGIKRQTPQMRRFMGIGQLLLEGADPAVWASRYQRVPITFPYEKPDYRAKHTDALIVGTLGDQTVPISSGISLARAVGVIDVLNEDERYGMTPNQFLVHNYVYEGIHWLDRFPQYPGTLFDPDNLDRGRFQREDANSAYPNADAASPLRITVRTGMFGRYSGLRLPYLKVSGEHTFNLPTPDQPFDIHTFMLNQTGMYLATGGAVLSDDSCLHHDVFMSRCGFFDRETFTPQLPNGPMKTLK